MLLNVLSPDVVAQERANTCGDQSKCDECYQTDDRQAALTAAATRHARDEHKIGDAKRNREPCEEAQNRRPRTNARNKSEHSIDHDYYCHEDGKRFCHRVSSGLTISSGTAAVSGRGLQTMTFEFLIKVLLRGVAAVAWSVLFADFRLPVILVNGVNGRRRVMAPVLEIGLTPIAHGVNPITTTDD